MLLKKKKKNTELFRSCVEILDRFRMEHEGKLPSIRTMLKMFKVGFPKAHAILQFYAHKRGMQYEEMLNVPRARAGKKKDGMDDANLKSDVCDVHFNDNTARQDTMTTSESGIETYQMKTQKQTQKQKQKQKQHANANSGYETEGRSNSCENAEEAKNVEATMEMNITWLRLPLEQIPQWPQQKLEKSEDPIQVVQTAVISPMNVLSDEQLLNDCHNEDKHFEQRSFSSPCLPEVSNDDSKCKLPEMIEHVKHLIQIVIEHADNGTMDVQCCQELADKTRALIRFGWSTDDLDMTLAMSRAFFVLASVYYSKLSQGNQNASHQALEYVNHALLFFKKSSELTGQQKMKTEQNNTQSRTVGNECETKNSNDLQAPLDRSVIDGHSIDHNALSSPLLFQNDWGRYWEYVCEVYILGGYILLAQDNLVQSFQYFKIALELAETGVKNMTSSSSFFLICVFPKVIDEKVEMHMLCSPTATTDKNKTSGAMSSIISAVQGLGLASFKMEDYNTASKYACKLVNIIVAANKNSDTTSNVAKQDKELNARVFHVSCLFHLVPSHPQLVRYIFSNLLEDYANASFETQPVNLIGLHVSLGKMFASLLKFEKVTQHLRAIQSIRAQDWDKQSRNLTGTLSMELIDTCLIELQKSCQLAPFALFSTDVEPLCNFLKELFSTERYLSNEFSETCEMQTLRQSRQVVNRFIFFLFFSTLSFHFFAFWMVLFVLGKVFVKRKPRIAFVSFL
ncbi:hypothetical protein RFI_09606 [Reticulomyxa filosa]|uniref:Uncharacterized protein n=1 Tax=Reticulomyxa filosa TaxID=46433 RepID=X6NMP0_RETFI|nr:hypothetical protein RFI_09606 [Reticulomyxa filosa]|eukprot:ETO27525.1 hypothetical protein RFI_09606 [Reticulomyxa filosa]